MFVPLFLLALALLFIGHALEKSHPVHSSGFSGISIGISIANLVWLLYTEL
jgi:hypothetical protein